MSMTENELRALRSYTAHLLEKYGFSIPVSDPVLPALYIIHKEMELNNKTNTDIAKAIQGSASKKKTINYSFTTRGEAIRFQIGIGLKWLLIVGSISSLLLVIVWWWSLQEDVAKAKYIINTSPTTSELLQRTMVDREGYYFLDFKKAPKGSFKFFEEYEQIDSKTVRIYLGKKD